MRHFIERLHDLIKLIAVRQSYGNYQLLTYSLKIIKIANVGAMKFGGESENGLKSAASITLVANCTSLCSSIGDRFSRLEHQIVVSRRRRQTDIPKSVRQIMTTCLLTLYVTILY